jgi:hypothetical protein
MSGDPAAVDGDPDLPAAPLAGRYALVRLLGQGSFGRTYLARDLAADGQLVAVKQLRAHGEDGWKRYELFEREAAVLAALRHHGIPAIHEHLRVPREGGEDVYLVMEYIEGSALRRDSCEGQVTCSSCDANSAYCVTHGSDVQGTPSTIDCPRGRRRGAARRGHRASPRSAAAGEQRGL